MFYTSQLQQQRIWNPSYMLYQLESYHFQRKQGKYNLLMSQVLSLEEIY